MSAALDAPVLVGDDAEAAPAGPGDARILDTCQARPGAPGQAKSPRTKVRYPSAYGYLNVSRTPIQAMVRPPRKGRSADDMSRRPNGQIADESSPEDLLGRALSILLELC